MLRCVEYAYAFARSDQILHCWLVSRIEATNILRLCYRVLAWKDTQQPYRNWRMSKRQSVESYTRKAFAALRKLCLGYYDFF